MPAGDISKRLCVEVREELGDLSNKFYSSDSLIYNRLAHYQSEIMSQYSTTKAEIEIVMTAGVYKYALSDRVLSIVDYRFSQVISFKILAVPFPGVLVNDSTSRTLEILNEPALTSGEKLTLICFIKPGPLDKISVQIDPIIETDYYEYLKLAIYSEHRTRLKEKNYKSLADVYALVSVKKQNLLLNNLTEDMSIGRGFKF